MASRTAQDSLHVVLDRIGRSEIKGEPYVARYFERGRLWCWLEEVNDHCLGQNIR